MPINDIYTLERPEDAVLPLARGQVHVAIEVGSQNCLGVEVADLSLVALLDAGPLRTHGSSPTLSQYICTRTHTLSLTHSHVDVIICLE